MSEPKGLSIFADEIADRVAERLRDRHVEQRVFSTADSAKYLGCSESQIQKLASSGVLRVVRVDSSLRFDRRDLDLLIETHKR